MHESNLSSPEDDNAGFTIRSESNHCVSYKTESEDHLFSDQKEELSHCEPDRHGAPDYSCLLFLTLDYLQISESKKKLQANEVAGMSVNLYSQ
jgi:hypothetical protein